MSSSYERIRLESPEDFGEDEASVCESLDDPPFALTADNKNIVSVEKHSLLSPQSVDCMDSGYFMEEKAGMESSPAAWSSITAGTEKTTQMGSSIASFSPICGLQQSNNHNNSNSFSPSPPQSTSEIDFEAAASVLASSSMLGNSLNLGGLTTEPSSGSNKESSVRFSQLLWEADDRNQLSKSRMPTLPEDQEMMMMMESSYLPHSIASSLAPRGSSIELFPTTRPNDYYSNSQQDSSNTQLRWPLTSSFVDRDIEASQLSDDTFQVRLKLSCSPQEVMDVVGNPDLLRLWCEPVESLVVTKSSEGSRSAMNRQDEGGDRKYDGEWIEATTAALSTPQQGRCLYSAGRAMWSFLGFPSYGKVTMFVERGRGQVGLTIGPFAGSTFVHHTINVIEDGESAVVVDKVRVAEEDEQYSSLICCCGVCSMAQQCIMPTLQGHKDQALTSMVRLRHLMNRGEAPRVDTGSLQFESYHGVSAEPLLS